MTFAIIRPLIFCHKPVFKSGAVERPGVIPVDSDGADCDLNNTLRCPAAAQLCCTIIQLLKAIVAPGAEAVCIHTQIHTHQQTCLPTPCYDLFFFHLNKILSHFKGPVWI